MRRTTVWLSMVVFALVTSAGPAFAIKPPTTKPSKPTVTKTQAPKSSTKPPKPAKASAPKASTTSGSKSAKVTAPKGQGSSKKSSTPAASTASTTTTTTAPTTDPTTPVWTNDVAKKLSTKPNHLAKLERALGVAPGSLTTAQINDATSGIKNFGQLNAMVNTVLNNSGVEFSELKGLMTGLDMNGDPIAGQTTTYSLGQAKQRLGIADGDDSSTSTTTTSTTSTKSKKRPNTTSGGTQ